MEERARNKDHEFGIILKKTVVSDNTTLQLTCEFRLVILFLQPHFPICKLRNIILTSEVVVRIRKSYVRTVLISS